MLPFFCAYELFEKYGGSQGAFFQYLFLWVKRPWKEVKKSTHRLDTNFAMKPKGNFAKIFFASMQKMSFNGQNGFLLLLWTCQFFAHRPFVSEIASWIMLAVFNGVLQIGSCYDVQILKEKTL